MYDSLAKQDTAKQLILKEINNVCADPTIVKQNGCAACHILYVLVESMQTNESDAADLLSEILLHNPKLNDLFIEMVERIHMKQRMPGIPFSIKNRNAKENILNLLLEIY